MTTASLAFLLIAAVVSVVDWVAVRRSNSLLEYISKPGATIAFLATAATLDVAHDAPWWWRIAALVFCLLGDVFLMLPRNAFIPGLASFAVAQMMFTVSFALGDTSATGWVIGTVIALPVAVLLARRFVTAIRHSGHNDLVLPVMVYMVVISSMAVSSVASGNYAAIAGAVIFMASDSLIAETRFVRPRPWHGVAIMATYHCALTGLVLGLL